MIGHAPAAPETGHRARIGREAIETTIETLIALLDALDGDCDLEDSYDREEEYTASGRYGVNQALGPLPWHVL